MDDINRADKALDCLMSETGSVGRCQGAVMDAYHVLVARKLVGTGELVRMLGLSRTRVGHLVAQPGFPEPYDELIMGKVWRIRDVETWAADHGRKLHPLDAD